MKKPKRPSKRRLKNWKGNLNDALRLSALRWFAMNMEMTTLEIYATNRDKFDALVGLLRCQADELAAFSKGAGDIREGNCGDGYVLCKDGLCAPMCDSHGGEEGVT